ncbi:MAG: BTAD domain-containing putative transcriptional regulator [Chloroflexota bacterium]
MVEVAAGSIADLLKQYRARAGLTQEALAERAGLSVRAISDLERGVKQHPYPHTVQRLVQALELDKEAAGRFGVAARRLGVGGGRSEQPATLTMAGPSLPLQPTAFIGRQREMGEVVGLLNREEVRLLTLTGPGGVGKTRLALRIAEEVAPHFSDGVVFVSLASLADPGLVPATIAAALGVREGIGQPILDALLERLGPKRVLVVLDNFEHLLPAGEAVSHLLGSCPQLKLLATSRAVLHLSAEHEYPVPPLMVPVSGHLPELEVLSRYDSVQLFIQRGQAIKPNFQLTKQNATAIAEICSQLDGLPLAIELAAARLRLFPPHALLERLCDRLAVLTGGAKDLPIRQQTLRNTLDWSYSLLAPDEQSLFGRLGVFAGGCTFEAADPVCNVDGTIDLLGGMTSLVEQSLVRQHEPQAATLEKPRFVMLETIREYAKEKLGARGEAADVRQRHAAYFLALAEQAHPVTWGGPDQRVWLARLELEHDNLRAALAWAEEAGEATLRLRLAGALGQFWFIHGHATEGRRQLERALAANPEAEDFPRARALRALGGLARQQGELDGAVAYFEESLALFRTVGDERWTAFTLFGLGSAWRDRGDWRHAMELFEASLVLSQDRGGAWGFVRGLPLGILAWFLLERGDQLRAVPLLEEALTLGRALGDQVVIGTALIGLGWAEHYAGDDAAGTALVEEALVLFRDMRHHQGNLDALASLGWMSLYREDSERSAMLFREALLISNKRGSRANAVDCLRGLGAVAGHRGQARQAAELFGAAERLQEAAGTPHYPSRGAYERALASARARLDDAAWVAGWKLGRGRVVEETIAAALDSGTPVAWP